MKVRTLLVVLAGLLLVLSTASCQFMDKLKARDHLNKGVQSYTAKNHEQAIEEFREAIELDPELVDAYLYLATTYRAQFVPLATSPENRRRGQEAIATFERVLDLNAEPSKQVNAIANIADLYRNMNEPDRAKDWYRKLMDVQEDRSQALYGIATIDYNTVDDKIGRDGENIPNLSEEEIEELNRLVEEGVDALRQALEINPRYSDAMEYLNLMYRKRAELADDDEDRRHWEREADRLAIQALEMRRQLQREAEAARRQVFQREQQEQSTN